MYTPYNRSVARPFFEGIPWPLLGLLWALGALWPLPVVWAQTVEDPNSQKALYANGKALYGEGRYADSIRAFQAAYRLNPLPGLLQNIGAAYSRLAEASSGTPAERQEHTANAIAYFEQYLAALDPPADPATQSRIAALRLRLRELQAPPQSATSARPEAGEVAKERPPLARRPWFIALMATLALVSAGGIATAVAVSLRPPSPPGDATVLDISQSSLQIRF